jgi:hypothetical protein
MFVLCLILLLTQQIAFAAQWYQIRIDKNDHPTQPVMDEVTRSLRVTGELFTRYKLILPEIVTIRVATTQDSYARALMHYLKASPAQAAELAKLSAGVSIHSYPVVILNGHYSNGFASTLPHEMFHQAQRQLATVNAPTWITEGSAELFEKLALHQAGRGVYSQYIRSVKQRLRQEGSLPTVRQVVSDWAAMFKQGKGGVIYNMATLMVWYLADQQGFDGVVYFYQLMHQGVAQDEAFLSAFHVTPALFYEDFQANLPRLLQL